MPAARSLTTAHDLSLTALRLDLIDSAGLAAIAAGIQPDCVLAEMRLESSLPAPFSPPAVDALGAAARRCGSLRAVWLGETEPSVAGSGGPLVRLQRALLVNVEAGAATNLPTLAWGHKPGAGSTSSGGAALQPRRLASGGQSPDSAEDDGLTAALAALRPGGELRTLRLTHEAEAARASLPRQLELLRVMMDCSSLRIAQLVNVGLGDAWAHALTAALPRMRTLRVLDVSHNYIGSAACRAVAAALPRNHSLLWVQLLPQWAPLERDAEQALSDALNSRRIKLDLSVRAARGVLSARGDVGEPSVAFQWRGAMLSTGGTSPAATMNPRFDEHFTLAVPASLLWPPSRTPLGLSLVDLRRSAQLNSDLPMSQCELPLSALLLADESVGVRCQMQRHPLAAPLAARGDAELFVELNTLHVGATHPDDSAPGVPLAWRHQQAEERIADFRAATKLQARWRGRHVREQAGKRRRRAFDLAALADEALAAHLGGRFWLALRRCGRGLWASMARAAHGQRAERGGESLLPLTIERSDQAATLSAQQPVVLIDVGGANATAEHAAAAWKKRQALMRLVLALLCTSICMLCASGLALLALLWTRQHHVQ